jgi:hypothetical protein
VAAELEHVGVVEAGGLHGDEDLPDRGNRVGDDPYSGNGMIFVGRRQDRAHGAILPQEALNSTLSPREREP